MTKIRKNEITNKSLSNIMGTLAAYFNLPTSGMDRETGQPLTVNDLGYAQDAVLKSVTNALFYQLKSAAAYHEKTVEIGRNLLQSTRHSPDLEDRLTAQRERIMAAQARVEIIRAALKEARSTYTDITGKAWQEPAFTPREKAPVSTAAAELAALLGQPVQTTGRDMDTETGDHRNLVA
jgi:hypothetical protein